MTQLSDEVQKSLFNYLKSNMEHVQQIHTFENGQLNDQKTQIIKDIVGMLYALNTDSDLIFENFNKISTAIDSLEKNFFNSLPNMIKLEFARLDDAKRKQDHSLIYQKRRNLIIMRNYWEGIPHDDISQKTEKEINKLFTSKKKVMDQFSSDLVKAEKEASEILERISEIYIEYDDGRDNTLSKEEFISLINRWKAVNQDALDVTFRNSIEQQLNEIARNRIEASYPSAPPTAQELHLQKLNILLETKKHTQVEKIEPNYSVTWNPFKAIRNILRRISDLLYPKEPAIKQQTTFSTLPSTKETSKAETSKKAPPTRRPAPKRPGSQ